MLPRTPTANYDRLTDPRAVTPCVSGCPHLSSLQTAPASSIQARLLRLTAAGSGRERVLCLRRAKKARDVWTFSQLQTPSPKARPLLPPAPPRHPLNGEPRACACAARLPADNCAGAERSGSLASHRPLRPGRAAKSGSGGREALRGRARRCTVRRGGLGPCGRKAGRCL